MSVKTKLQMGFGVILLFLVITSAIGMYYLKENNTTLEMIEKESEMVSLYNDIAFQTVRANAAIRGYMLYENEEMKSNHYEIRETLHNSIDQLLDAGRNNSDFETFLTQLHEWEAGIDEKIFPLLERGHYEEAETAAIPILGKGSQELVAFGKSMANSMTDEIRLNIEHTKNDGQKRLIEMIVIVVVAVVFSFAISTFFGHRTAKNIKEVANKMDEFSSGNLLATLHMKSKDEFGQLAEAFNEMASKLQSTMKKVGQSSGQVAATSEQLTASSYEVSLATETVTEAMQDIASGVEEQNMMTSDVNQLSTNILGKMNAITENIEHVNEAAVETKNLAHEGHQSVTNVMEQMTIISDNTDELTGRMKELDTNTASIGQAVHVIKEIASQTNLLAINASIEAARSGEHGKGFAVVAEEVRKLADESNRAALEIEKIVDMITTSTEKIIEDIYTNEQSVSVGREKVDIASQTFSHIDHSVQDVQKQTEAVTEAIRQIHMEIEELVKDIDHISDVAIQSSGNIQNVAASCEEQNAAMEEVAAASTHLSQMAIDLQETVQNFKY